MFLDLNGPDFVRVQQGGNSRQADALHPDVIFSGAYDDGTCMFFQANMNANTSGTIMFGRTLPWTPIVFGCLCLNAGFTQGSTSFGAGEYIMAQHYRQQNFGQNPTHNRSFYYTVLPDRINLGVTTFSGLATFLVVDN